MQSVLSSKANITVVPPRSELMTQLLVAEPDRAVPNGHKDKVPGDR
jgi:hypothetical protein